jgi:AcrR family transcriptional regulator
MPSRDLENALLDATEVVLGRDGPAAVTVRAVATEAGVAPMGVYNRFGSKEGLIDALLIRGFNGLREAVAPHGETDPLERLIASGVRYREFALAHPEQYSAMFGGELAVAEPSDDLLVCGAAAFQELIEHVCLAIAAGLLMAGDPTEMAQQIWATVHGAVALEMQKRAFTENPETTYLALLRMLVRGLAPH